MIMTHECGDPFGEETIAAAVRRAVALTERMPSNPLEGLRRIRSRLFMNAFAPVPSISKIRRWH